ncbi:MAG: hypothetical protein AAB336_00470 [Acidobacteriota bacterium]
MFGKIFKSLAIISLFLIFASNSSAQTRITGIQAKLFYQNTGKFSEDIFTNQSDLWNVYLDYVYSILVIVQTEGKNDGKQFDTPNRIELSGRYIPFEGTAKEITVRKTTPIWFDENGKANVGFWIENIGCEPLKLTVKIKGQTKTLRKTIKFGCGE